MGYVLQDINLRWHCGMLALYIVWTTRYFVNQNLMVTEQEMAVLREYVPDLLYDDGNSRVDLYMKVCDVISAVRN